MKKIYYSLLKKECDRKINKLNNYLKEYNDENNLNIDFRTFFIKVLNYSEEEYNKLVTYKVKQEKIKENKKKEGDNPKPRQINQDKLIKYGIGDFNNPEYEKYWNIFTDYNKNYLTDTSIIGKKTLKAYFIYKYNYSEDKAYEESKKISKIIFKRQK